VSLRHRVTLNAIALALAAMVLTSLAVAQSDPPRDTSTAATDGTTTPLGLRPSKPIELAQEPAHAGLGWKIVAVMALLGGAAFYLRKRVGAKRVEDGQLTIVRRAAVGIRSEILIVDVEGQRLLLGVTPHSIQSLAVLDGDDAATPNAFVAPTQERALGERFAAMLDSAESRVEASRQESSVRAEDEVAGQARGLLALRRQG
jgi:flagellar biogenesis protein FliO